MPLRSPRRPLRERNGPGLRNARRQMYQNRRAAQQEKPGNRTPEREARSVLPFPAGLLAITCAEGRHPPARCFRRGRIDHQVPSEATTELDLDQAEPFGLHRRAGVVDDLQLEHGGLADQIQRGQRCDVVMHLGLLVPLTSPRPRPKSSPGRSRRHGSPAALTGISPPRRAPGLPTDRRLGGD